MSFVVLKPGLFTTIQDAGRYQSDLPFCGVMDSESFRLGNYLVGNTDGEAVLEMTLLGPTIQFLNKSIIAITGANIKASINGVSLKLNHSILVEKGDVLELKEVSNGCRAYLSIKGTWNIPFVLGSKSTDVLNGFGGVEGRPLKKGDVISVSGDVQDYREIGIQREIECSMVTLEASKGPEYDWLSISEQKTLEQTIFKVSNDSNRVGIKSIGKCILSNPLNSVISSPTFTGVVQLPNSGLPIILGNDCAISGGYPRVLVVNKGEMHKVGQLTPGSEFQFRVS